VVDLLTQKLLALLLLENPSLVVVVARWSHNVYFPKCD
jgi:hypothetical protein